MDNTAEYGEHAANEAEQLSQDLAATNAAIEDCKGAIAAVEELKLLEANPTFKKVILDMFINDQSKACTSGMCSMEPNKVKGATNVSIAIGVLRGYLGRFHSDANHAHDMLPQYIAEREALLRGAVE